MRQGSTSTAVPGRTYDDVSANEYKEYLESQKPVDIYSLLHAFAGFIFTYWLHIPIVVAIALHVCFEIWEQSRSFSRLWNYRNTSYFSGYFGDTTQGSQVDTLCFIAGASLGVALRQSGAKKKWRAHNQSCWAKRDAVALSEMRQCGSYTPTRRPLV